MPKQNDIEPAAMILPVEDFVQEVVTNANNDDKKAVSDWLKDLNPPPSDED